MPTFVEEFEEHVRRRKIVFRWVFVIVFIFAVYYFYKSFLYTVPPPVPISGVKQEVYSAVPPKPSEVITLKGEAREAFLKSYPVLQDIAASTSPPRK